MVKLKYTEGFPQLGPSVGIMSVIIMRFLLLA